MLRVRRRALGAALLLAFAAAPAPAATITVDTTEDTAPSDGTCTLRDAVRSANLDEPVGACVGGAAGADTIVLAAGTYEMTIGGAKENNSAKGDLDVTDPLTITGAGAGTTTIDANGLDRAIDATAALTPTGVTVTGGVTPNGTLSSA